ncbi:MAG TPA: hypothetical protein GX405_00510 [Rhizobiales bacterium]|nr:hypothetical protein [Hyphomicrobiales bacterium]
MDVCVNRVPSVCVVAAVLLPLAACASPPKRINDICAVFDQRDGWFDNWHRAAKRAERKYGVPVPVLMATVRKESGFRADAKPPRKMIFGFIPGKRISSAYGYSQALDGTWAEYKSDTGNFAARRSDFEDAIDFVGWYHAKSAAKFGIAPNDAYNLYLAYYSGWGGYARGEWRNNGIEQTARETAEMARTYSMQLSSCR